MFGWENKVIRCTNGFEEKIQNKEKELWDFNFEL